MKNLLMFATVVGLAGCASAVAPDGAADPGQASVLMTGQYGDLSESTLWADPAACAYDGERLALRAVDGDRGIVLLARRSDDGTWVSRADLCFSRAYSARSFTECTLEPVACDEGTCFDYRCSTWGGVRVNVRLVVAGCTRDADATEAGDCRAAE